MTPFPDFMELNRNLLLFTYGLVFFSLGIIAALHSRSYSRLELARSLKWLAGFGLSHGVFEWGDLFIPLHSQNLSVESQWFWTGVQMVLLAVSFVCLYNFGISLLPAQSRPGWLKTLPYLVFAGWSVWMLAIKIPAAPDLTAWRNPADAVARYLLAFPGGVLSAYTLRKYAIERINALDVPHIIHSMRLAGVAIFLYAVFAGLVVPPVSFFPGNLVNSATFTESFGVPPLIFRSLVGLVLTIMITRALEVFDIEYARRIELMEQQQMLAAERERIARELHDGAIQSVYTAGLLVEAAHAQTEPGSQTAVRLERAITALNQATQDLRSSLEDLSAKEAALPLKYALQKLVEDNPIKSLIVVRLSLELPDELKLMPVNQQHLLAIVAEALSNVVRHAHANQVRIEAGLRDGKLVVTVEDDGAGLPPDLAPGYGVRNMRDRARLLGGELRLLEGRDHGTRLELETPWSEKG